VRHPEPAQGIRQIGHVRRITFG